MIKTPPVDPDSAETRIGNVNGSAKELSEFSEDFLKDLNYYVVSEEYYRDQNGCIIVRQLIKHSRTGRMAFSMFWEYDDQIYNFMELR